MRHIKHLIAIFILTLGISITNGYVFGIKSADNTIGNITQIQDTYNFDFKIVGFIFDPRTDDILRTINNLNENFGTGKIYHITLSPNEYSAKQVAEGYFDNEYRQFFQTVKNNNLKVIFRTMHEMNGGRYPRGSNPERFKEARIHVWQLSRDLGLDQNSILFDFSVNHRDMPTNGTPSQSAKLITCNRYKTGCYKFEDYYPGDNFVDIVGVTFYNRGKATYSRQRYSPSRILNDTSRNTLSRLKSFNKPIFIDEVGTTAVRYSGAYSLLKSKIIYDTDYYKKNERLSQLSNFMIENPDIIGMTYFNTDFTNGMTRWVGGEADRAIINLYNEKIYYGIYDLYGNSDFNDFKKLENLFNINNDDLGISEEEIKEVAQVMVKKFGKKNSLTKINEMKEISQSKDLNKILSKLEEIIKAE